MRLALPTLEAPLDPFDSYPLEEAPHETQAVILAAGRGSRMGMDTDRRPKCLLPIGDGTLLDHQLDVLSAAGVSRIWIVAGYEAEQVRKASEGRAEIIYNDLWAETNSLYSLWLCRDDCVDGSLLVLNCDVLAHPDIVSRLLTHPGSAFSYDSTSGHDDEHMKVALEGGWLTSMSKSLRPDCVKGENVGILRFDGLDVPNLFSEADSLVGAGGRDLWLATAVERLARRIRMRGVDVSDLPWCEIDFPDDLLSARREVWPAIRSWSEEAA